MKNHQIVIVEPNLRQATGHVWTGMLALKQYVVSRPSLGRRVHFVCHEKADAEVLKGIRGVHPIVEAGCFETPSHLSASRSLKRVEKELGLTNRDTVVFLTSHANEVLALARRAMKKDSPRFIAIIHQLNRPPIDERHQVSHPVWGKKIQNAVNQTLAGRLSIACTPVFTLQRAIEGFLGCRVTQLSVPFLDPGMAPLVPSSKSSFVFLGDGRMEKGLFEIVKFAQSNRSLPERIVVQVQNPRYFKNGELVQLKKYVGMLRRADSDSIIHGRLSVNKYHTLIRQSRAILLPYDPMFYHERMSGIAVEAGMAGVPVIATTGTWTSKLIESGKLAGVQVAGISRKSMSLALDKMKREENILRRKGSLMRRKFVRAYSPAAFFRAIKE